MQWRIIEDEARGVMFEKKRAQPVFWSELDLLVRAEGCRVLVDGLEMPMPREKQRSVRHLMDRVVLLQQAIGWIGILVERVRQRLEGKAAQQRCGLALSRVAMATVRRLQSSHERRLALRRPSGQ